MTLSDNKKKRLVINMILLIYLLKHIIIKTGLKMKNQPMQQEKVIEKDL